LSLPLTGSEIEAKPYVMWIDNYSKIYGNRASKIEKLMYSACLWTAVGVRPLDMGSCKRFPKAAPLPKDIFVLKARIFSLVDECRFVPWAKSALYKHHLHTVPPGPTPYPSVPDAYWSGRADTSMETFTPYSIWPENVGSNVSLRTILTRRLRSMNESWILADVNLRYLMLYP